MIYLELFYVFFKTGLFTIGGGLAALPLLQDYALEYGWVTLEEFYTMVAVSESTPGPIGINMATYVGFDAGGVLGGVVATLAMALPSIIIITIIASFFFHFNEKSVVKNAFYGIRPAVTGLIATAAYGVLSITILNYGLYKETSSLMKLFDYKALILFGVCYVLHHKFDKLHPIVYIAGGALFGIFLM